MARNNNDLDLALSVWDEDWHDRLKAGFNAITTAFPGLHITIEEIFGEGDFVALSSTLRGTHRGMYSNIPPTQITTPAPAQPLFRGFRAAQKAAKCSSRPIATHSQTYTSRLKTRLLKTTKL
jgi:hypothetical protein